MSLCNRRFGFFSVPYLQCCNVNESLVRSFSSYHQSYHTIILYIDLVDDHYACFLYFPVSMCDSPNLCHPMPWHEKRYTSGMWPLNVYAVLFSMCSSQSNALLNVAHSILCFIFSTINYSYRIDKSSIIDWYWWSGVCFVQPEHLIHQHLLHTVHWFAHRVIVITNRCAYYSQVYTMWMGCFRCFIHFERNTRIPMMDTFL